MDDWEKKQTFLVAFSVAYPELGGISKGRVLFSIFMAFKAATLPPTLITKAFRAAESVSCCLLALKPGGGEQ